MKYFSFFLIACILVSCQNMNEPKTEAVVNKTDSTSGFAPVNGLNMYYEIHGSGTPLVLIHGGGSTIYTTFGQTLKLFAKKYKVIAVELQAHGHTKDRDQPETFEQDADDVAALLTYLKIDKAHIFGFSNGGNTAMQIAIRHPEKVNKLVVASAFYKREGMMPGFFDRMQKASLENMPKPLQTAYLSIKNNNQQGLQAMHDRDKNRMLAFKDWKDEDLAAIKAPTMVIAGSQDVVSSEHTKQMASKIPNAQPYIIIGNHGSYIGEICAGTVGNNRPEITVAMIEAFLN